MSSKHVGSTLTSFLDGEDIRKEVDLRTKKKLLAAQILAKMTDDGLTRTTLAKRMRTSRTAVNRLLDPADTSLTLGTLARASQALDLELSISLQSKTHAKGRRKLHRARSRATSSAV